MKKLVAYIALALLLAEVALLLLSWLLSATMAEEGVRSLLSPEGVRFLLGGFTSFLQKPLLIWLLLLSMAWGCIQGSGLQAHFRSEVSIRQRQALRLSMVLLLVFVGVVLFLTIVPHAVLLSATGKIWPSAFSRALIPLVVLAAILVSTAYGFASRHFTTIGDVCQSLASGISSAAPLLLLYILAVQLFESLRFVFSFS